MTSSTRRSVPLPGPPPGDPWDTPLESAALAFVDLEMTGLEPAKDRVLEVCIERVVGGNVVRRLHTLVRPDGGETGNVHVHGIDEAAVASAPTFPEIAAEVEALLTNAVFVAHGASWDIAFVRAEMARAGSSFDIPFYLDTLNLSRRTFGLARHSLDALREHFKLDVSRAHRADADVLALRGVWERCVEGLTPATPRELWEVRIAERKARERIVQQCKDALDAKREVTIVYRPRAKAAQSLRLVLTAIDLGLDPPRVIGYQLPGRGRRELRADRILRIETNDPASS